MFPTIAMLSANLALLFFLFIGSLCPISAASGDSSGARLPHPARVPLACNIF
jgi:hypothetical protein